MFSPIVKARTGSNGTPTDYRPGYEVGKWICAPALNKEHRLSSGEDTKYILEPGGTEVRTAAGGARRYRKPLKSFRWPDFKCLFIESFDAWSKHKGPRLGASLGLPPGVRQTVKTRLAVR
jgi:hypothetical protein